MLVYRIGQPPVDAAKVHAAAPLADLHAHPGLNAYYLRRDLSRRHAPPWFWNPLRQQLDVPRAREGGLKVLTSCAYAPAVPFFPKPFRAAIGCFDAIERLCAANPGEMALAKRGEVARVVASGKLAVIHAAEGGHHLEGSLEKLEQLAARGLRYLTLTHFVHNGLAQPAKTEGQLAFAPFRGPPGVTALGRQVVKRCEELGVLVDVSHCSDRSFADVASIATRPLVATHTGFRRFFPTERNLSDEQLRLIAASGGMVGIITWSWLLRPRGLVADLEHLVDAIVHGALVAGPEHVGIGTDFDGYVWSAARIREARHYPRIAEALARRGFNEGELSGILGGNYLRVLGETGAQAEARAS